MVIVAVVVLAVAPSKSHAIRKSIQPPGQLWTPRITCPGITNTFRQTHARALVARVAVCCCQSCTHSLYSHFVNHNAKLELNEYGARRRVSLQSHCVPRSVADLNAKCQLHARRVLIKRKYNCLFSTLLIKYPLRMSASVGFAEHSAIAIMIRYNRHVAQPLSLLLLLPLVLCVLHAASNVRVSAGIASIAGRV